MKKRLIAKRYAEALFTLVKENEPTLLDDYGDCLHVIAQACNINPLLAKVLESPIITDEKKLSILEALVQKRSTLSYCMRFYTILVEAQRIHLICEIDDSYQSLLNQHKGRCIATVATAVALDEEDKALIHTSLAKLGDIVDIVYTVEPSLLGGLLLSIGDIHIDASLRNRLNAIRDSIIRGGYYAN